MFQHHDDIFKKAHSYYILFQNTAYSTLHAYTAFLNILRVIYIA